MEYTVQKLAQLSGISSRTLRYYDEIGLLKPARISSSGYRIYGEKEIKLLQQILFYRELDVNLEIIKEIITKDTFDYKKALVDHHEKLLEKRKQIDLLIANVEKTIENEEGRITMSNQEKFKGFKQNLLDENEKKYGKEIRAKYGKETVEKSNKKFVNMSEQEFKEAEDLAKSIIEHLYEAMETNDPSGEIAQKTAELHKKWLCLYWDHYSKEAHASLAQMYVDDERFTAYYDKDKPGAAKFLRDAIHIYTGMNK